MGWNFKLLGKFLFPSTLQALKINKQKSKSVMKITENKQQFGIKLCILFSARYLLLLQRKHSHFTNAL